MVLVDADCLCDIVGYGSVVARQHHGAAYACRMQCVDSLSSIGLQLVGNDNMPRIGAVDSDMNDRALCLLGAFVPICPHGSHQFAVAYAHPPTVDGGLYALPCNLLHLLDGAVVRLVGIGLAQRYGNRVIAVPLHMGGEV